MSETAQRVIMKEANVVRWTWRLNLLTRTSLLRNLQLGIQNSVPPRPSAPAAGVDL